MDISEVKKGLESIQTAMSEKADELFSRVNKRLDEERSVHEEMLQAKADGKAFSELQEKLAKLEEATNAASKAFDEEIAALKMKASPNANNMDSEIKKSFFHVLQYGTAAGLAEGEKSRLAEVLSAQSELSDKPMSVDRVKAMLAGIDTTGGLLVLPAVLESSILKYVTDGSALYEMAAKTSISSPTYRRDARISRAGASWEGESDTWPETKTPDYGQVEINVHKLIAYPTISRDLMEDSRLNMEAEIMDFTREAFRDKICEASVLGDGKRKPMGILSYPTEKQTKAVDTWGKIGFVTTGNGSGLHAENPADALIDLQSILKTSYLNNASWLMNRTTGSALRKLKDKDGNYLWQPSFQAATPATFMGYPVRYDVNMPDIEANKFPIAFGNFNQAMLVVNRRGMTIIRDMTSVPGHVRFHIDLRLGMGLRNFEAVKLLKVSA